MAKSRATLTHGTARDVADTGAGYVASGEGEFSRRAARPDKVRMKGYHRPPRQTPQHPHAKDIGFHEVAIETMKRRLTVEKDTKRIAKLKRDIEAKTKFVAKLRRPDNVEMVDEKPGADRYEIIDSEGSYDRWDEI